MIFEMNEIPEKHLPVTRNQPGWRVEAGRRGDRSLSRAKSQFRSEREERGQNIACLGRSSDLALMNQTFYFPAKL